MEDNDHGGTILKGGSTEEDPPGSHTTTSQNLGLTNNCQSYPISLDVNDDFFAQAGFTYTGFLLDGLEPSTHKFRKNSPDCTEGGEHLAPMYADSTAETNQDWEPVSPSTFHADAAENPWDVNVFNDIELDRVHEEGSTSNSKQGSNANTTEFPAEIGQDSGTVDEDAAEISTTTDDQQITENDVENFLSNEKMTETKKEKPENDDTADLKPEIGMSFSTREEVQKFFNMYSYVVGFSVATTSVYRTTSKKRNNEIIRFTMKCNKHGSITEPDSEQAVPQRQSTVIAKTNCKTEMVCAEKNGVWRITGLNLLHNHDLSPQSRFFRSHIYMSDGEKEMIRTMKNCNMPTRDMVAVLAFIRGGMNQLPYNKRKVSNYSTTIGREVGNNDMMEVWEWFCKKRTENPQFFYSIEYDKEKKVRCVFWADAKARLYYDTCGDCISFDTTFLTNRYNLPFAPFVGVSPHGHTYLFGCAFIVNEQAGTFKWLFQQFLQAMGGTHPVSIITDGDKAMENAIPQVFPNATHRGCLFHVKKKIDDKGGTVFKANEGLYEELQDIIDKSLTVHEFETLWQAMINEFNVGNVKIFDDLWKTRKRWVPVYFKSKFFPFIQTTARSEGTNALFKRGVGAQFSMTSFLREYQRIMDTIHAREDECDHNVMNKKVRPKKFQTHYYIERQAHELYNLSIFRKFQHILKDVTRLDIDEEEKGQKYWLFQAANYEPPEHRPRRYLVQVKPETMEYSCICCKFEKDGMLCSHILKVMLHLRVKAIPEKYIIDRWRKKEKKLNQTLQQPLSANDDSTVLRFNVLSRMLGHTASTASKNKRKYNFMLQVIPRLESEMAKFDTETEEETANGQNSSNTTIFNVNRSDESASTLVLRDPDVVDTKGRPRLLTIKEQIKKNLFYNCSHCGSGKHTLKNCDKKHLPPVELDKRKNKRTKKQTGCEGSATNQTKAQTTARASKRNNPTNTTGDNSCATKKKKARVALERSNDTDQSRVGESQWVSFAQA